MMIVETRNTYWYTREIYKLCYKIQHTKLIEPSKLVKLGTKAGQLVPEKIKKWGINISLNISEKKLYSQMMNVIGSGFKTIEEQAAKFSVNEKQIITKVNQNSGFEIQKLAF